MFLSGIRPHVAWKRWSHRKETVKGYPYAKIMVMGMMGWSAWKDWWISSLASALSQKKNNMKAQDHQIGQTERKLRKYSLQQAQFQTRLPRAVSSESFISQDCIHSLHVWLTHGKKVSCYIQAELMLFCFSPSLPSRLWKASYLLQVLSTGTGGCP